MQTNIENVTRAKHLDNNFTFIVALPEGQGNALEAQGILLPIQDFLNHSLVEKYSAQGLLMNISLTFRRVNNTSNDSTNSSSKSEINIKFQADKSVDFGFFIHEVRIFGVPKTWVSVTSNIARFEVHESNRTAGFNGHLYRYSSVNKYTSPSESNTADVVACLLYTSPSPRDQA
eukprot:TRINITY_DN7707_c0_g1_i10.p1 TRINITY_DN7707_c0_g1~~TRINITY_DN7707_c0_g1_i10.p1  ORF type:complete len:174 (-),score=44.34 TRINITY_DN7707_c0_g1_i10:68-589(-)